MKIAIFNDTGNFHHVGCMAVSDAHVTMLSAHGIDLASRYFVNEYQDLWCGSRAATRQALINSPLESVLRSVDAVMVNGEGTIHHGAGLHLLAILERAIELGKGAFLVNATLQDIREYQDVLSRLDDLVVRELRSAKYALTLGAKPRIVADSICEANFDSGMDEFYKGRIVVTDCHHSRPDIRAQLDMVSEVFEDDAISFPLEGNERLLDWKKTLTKFRAAKLIITGRYHGVYLALMAGTPFIALPSNTWKIDGLLEMIGASSSLWSEGSLIRFVAEMLRNPIVDDKDFGGAFLRRPLMTLSGLVEFSVKRSSQNTHGFAAGNDMGSRCDR